MSFEIPDVNVLLALAREDSPEHERARAWLLQAERFATTPATEAGAVRLLINPRTSGEITTAARACAWLAGLRRHPKAEFIVDDATIAEPRLDIELVRGHRQIPDFHLLDLALKHDAVLVTFDKGIGAAFGHVAGQAIRVL